MSKPIKMLPAKAGRKRRERRTEPLEKRAVELARLDYPRVNSGDPFDTVTRAFIASEFCLRLLCPGRWKDLGLTVQEAIDMACYFTDQLDQYGDRAMRVHAQAYAMFPFIRETTIEIDAERYAEYLLSLPAACKTPKGKARDLRVAVFLHRAADHHDAHDGNLIRALAQEIGSVILDDLGGQVAITTDCQRFLSAHAERFGPHRCLRVSDLVARLPDDVVAGSESYSFQTVVTPGLAFQILGAQKPEE